MYSLVYKKVCVCVGGVLVFIPGTNKKYRSFCMYAHFHLI